jgi:hypothetical protein
MRWQARAVIDGSETVLAEAKNLDDLVDLARIHLRYRELSECDVLRSEDDHTWAHVRTLRRVLVSEARSARVSVRR